ncbi:hypothetical protein TIFTF001_003553 [Ficus carica]|uniref:Glutathione peroxidase n=1 Tax=Ficus carica TaxID=3494 RepID=A0AA88A0N8_FICCA|nr:hypothetical protein TIFTF001_003553 [Ficus carica]
MLCYSTRFISSRNPSLSAISASVHLAKRFSSKTKPILLSSPQVSSSCSTRIVQAQFSRSVLSASRSEHTMASQSNKGSVYDFTVKIHGLGAGGLGFGGGRGLGGRGSELGDGGPAALGLVRGLVGGAGFGLGFSSVGGPDQFGPEGGEGAKIVSGFLSGLTNSNYTELSQLYEQYKNQGFEILAFPCNQFGAQEPGTNEQIVEFACTRFKAEYPIFDKVDVNGENAAPIYKFLKASKGGLFGDSIKWNFSKFLVDKEGNVVDRYAPTTSPLSIEKDVKKLLEKA